MSSLRICIVSPLFHPNTGGPGRQAFTMAEKLNQKGVALTVITRELDIEIPELSGVKIYRIKTVNPGQYSLIRFSLINIIISASFSLGALARLLLLRKQFDIVQFYGASLPLLICLPLLKVLKKEVVVKVSGAKPGMEMGSLKGSILRPLLSVIYSLVDRIIVMSDELRHKVLIEGFPEKKIARIPNGVNTELFYPCSDKERKELKNNNKLLNKKVLVYSGWLVEGKGLDTLLEAFRLVVSENRETKLLLLGKGPLKDRLKDKADSLNISDKVCFKGNVTNVHEFLNSADIFVFPSFREGMPNSLLEAMACGLPVIASRIGGIVDIVEDNKSAILFDPGDVSGLASAIIKLLNNDEIRQALGAEARKRIEGGFSIDRVADEYIKLYEKLAA
ncbi:MAG: hypothetical protein A2X59_12325 [Nitrospirae bacterium GWC2_42_7]|nr:MAG: hypothetical protein A2X59_12325 [Nitrospirae bacterium GWC2_42_7]